MIATARPATRVPPMKFLTNEAAIVLAVALAALRYFRCSQASQNRHPTREQTSAFGRTRLGLERLHWAHCGMTGTGRKQTDR